MINKIGNRLMWFGVVEDRMDPLFLGRCRIRIVGVHTDNKIELPVTDLPWAWPLQSIGSAAMSGVGQAPVGPVEGTWIAVTFLDDSFQQPFMLGTIGGIPIKQNEKSEDIVEFLLNTVQTQVKQEEKPPANVVTDSSGEPVKTGSGGYLVTEPEPTTAKKLGNLSEDQYNKLKEDIGQRESGGKYDAVQSKTGSYLGKYQMGAAALEDAGYIKPGSYKKYGTKAIDQPGAWSGKEGVGSKEDFLKNKTAQENAMDSNLKTNYSRTGMSASVPAEKQAGVLAASHLVGAGGAKKYLNGENPKDAFGTGADEYYKIGYKSASGQTTNEAPTPDNIAETAVDKNIENNTNSDKENAKFDIVNMPEVQKKLKTLATDDIGFTDPNKKYPKEAWLKEPDTHRLARNQSIDKTIVPPKEQERDKDIAIANSDKTWEQQLIPYNAKYPYNHIFESESGHTIELDDTAGSERIHVYHKSGTFVEFDPTGSIVYRSKGHSVRITEKDDKTHIMGSGIILIDGDFAVEVQKSLQIEVHGDAQIKVDGNVKQQIEGNYDCKVGGNINMECGGKMSLKGGSMIAGDAGTIHWNSGNSDSAESVENFSPELTILNPPTRQNAEDFTMEDAKEEDKVKYIAEKKLSNNVPKEEPMKPEEAKKDETPPPNIEPYKTDCEEAAKQKPYTRNTRLSTNFTLGQLCVTVGGGQTSMPPEAGQVGLTQDKIICNLMNLCLNVLEPLKQKYPDLIINSGFRIGSGTSQHNKGMAVDVSRRSIESSANKKTAMQDWSIEVKNSVPFDQMILETSGGPSSAWVHISNNPGGNRPASDPNKMITINTSSNKKTSGLGFA